MAYLARKPMTLLGIRYKARTEVPLDRLNLNPALRRRLIEQRRVVPHVVEPAAVAQLVEPEAQDVAPVIAEEDVARCSAVTSTGNRCKRDAGEDGICGVHRGALARKGTPNESTEG